MVLSQGVQRFVQRGAHRRDLRVFFRRQIVKVLVRGFTRMNLIDNAIEPRHQKRGKAKVGVSHRIREAHFDAASLVACRMRNANRG